MVSKDKPRFKNRADSCLLSLTIILCLLISILFTEETVGKNDVVFLHSEWSHEDSQNFYYSADLGASDDNDDQNWITSQLRQLKRGGGGSSRSSSSRSGRSSYGNCYGDRCDNNGGSSNTAIIIISVVGGCLGIFLIWALCSYCMEKKRKAAKKARKKNKNNRVGDSSHSDSDAPKEPIVIHHDVNSMDPTHMNDAS